MLNFSCIDNTNKLYLASAPQHLANRWRTPAKTKLNYLNLKVEIPTNDDACHILKFQQIGRRRKRRGMVWLRFEMMTEMMSINIMNYFQKGNGLSGLNILNHCGVCLFHGCTSSNSSSFIFWILFGVWGLNLRFEFGLYLNLNLLRGSGSGILLNLNPKPQVQNQVWTGFRRFPNQTAASLSTCYISNSIDGVPCSSQSKTKECNRCCKKNFLYNCHCCQVSLKQLFGRWSLSGFWMTFFRFYGDFGLVDWRMSTVGGFWCVLVTFVSHDVMWKGQEREKVFLQNKYLLSHSLMYCLCYHCRNNCND